MRCSPQKVPEDLSSPARPAPARALTPRPRWRLTLAATVPGAWHLYQPEFRTNSRRANAAASQPSIHLSRATGAPPSCPRLVSRVGVRTGPLKREFPPLPGSSPLSYLTDRLAASIHEHKRTRAPLKLWVEGSWADHCAHYPSRGLWPEKSDLDWLRLKDRLP